MPSQRHDVRLLWSSESLRSLTRVIEMSGRVNPSAEGRLPSRHPGSPLRVPAMIWATSNCTSGRWDAAWLASRPPGHLRGTCRKSGGHRRLARPNPFPAPSSQPRPAELGWSGASARRVVKSRALTLDRVCAVESGHPDRETQIFFDQ